MCINTRKLCYNVHVMNLCNMYNMCIKKRVVNMNEIKRVEGELVSRPTTSSNNENELTIFHGNLEALFKRFVVFIDASPATVRTYKISLHQWFKYMQAHSIYNPTMDDVRAYRADLKAAGKKPTTIQNYIIAVKQFFKWTEAEGLYPDIAKNVKGAKLSRNFKKDYLTTEQAKNVLKAIDRSTVKGLRDYTMISLMLTMGLRTIEVVRANVGDIRNAGETTVLYVQGKGHIEKDDAVRMPEHIHQLVGKYLATRKDKKEDSPLFTSTSNHHASSGRMTTRSIRRIVKTAFRNAGYDSPRLTAHSTRHTAATLSLLNGATLQETQELLRHKNLQTTEIYAHNIDVAKNEASSKVDNAIFND